MRLAGIGNKTLHVQRTAHEIIFNTEKTVEIIISDTLWSTPVNSLPDEDEAWWMLGEILYLIVSMQLTVIFS